jgi:hypothetical protein
VTSNYAFDQYDQAFAALIAINQHAFDQAISDGPSELGGCPSPCGPDAWACSRCYSPVSGRGWPSTGRAASAS